ncbi:hypothetical protein CHS0354_025881 [Potamilus streckersoni]|uniref:Coiled-coil domain-containing protein 191 n=1 Tax=Potamilus streckersoni TaxID=2493646 RepID=A0AAE0WDJ0_9BIVA|nr:hypothetical protein CHS0354_025881 [Potamilus streckersoni]
MSAVENHELMETEEVSHKPGLYRWKRQADSRVYSRSQKLSTNDDIQNWIKKVEDASNRAAEQVFGINHSNGRARGKALALATKEQLQEHDQVQTEAHELLSQWMTERVDFGKDDEPDSVDDIWHQRAIESDVKREWDHLLANNYEEFGLQLSSRKTTNKPEADPYSHLYEMDDSEAVSTVLQNMMEKELIKESFTRDLGFDELSKHKDPRTKMQLRHQQVKENRERRQKELEKRHREIQAKKEAYSEARQILAKEDREKALKMKKEEMEIRKEMAVIRKLMAVEKQQAEEKKRREKEEKEAITQMAAAQVSMEQDDEMRIRLEERRKAEERQRKIKLRLEEMAAKQVAENLKILQRHFSSWYNVVLERQLQMGKARAMSDWKLLFRTWNAWKSFVRSHRLDKETKKHEMNVKLTQRNAQVAESHSRMKLMRKYFIAWQVWVKSEQERHELEQEQSSTREKMMALLQAAAAGKLKGEEQGEITHRNQRTKSARDHAQGTNQNKVDELFEQSKRPKTSHSDTSQATSRSNSQSEASSMGQRSRLPQEPWQITRAHLKLTKEEMLNLGDHSLDSVERSEITDAKIRKRFGKMPWMNTHYVINNFEHRHTAQKKILDEQRQQIKEQKRIIQELQYKNKNDELQKELSEQRALLEKLLQQQWTPRPSGTEKTNAKSVGENNNSSNNNCVREKPSTVHLVTDCNDVSSVRKNEPVTSRTDRSDNTSASENSKHLALLRRMEERAAERARSKAERDAKRKKAEEERLAQLQAEEAERRRQMEEEKRARAEAYREKKRLEQQRDLERQEREERMKKLNVLADEHYQKSILKFRGFLPFKRLVQIRKQQEQLSIAHYQNTLQRKVLKAWYTHVRQTSSEKESLANEMYTFLIIKKCFNSWRKYKYHTEIEIQKADKHYQQILLSKILHSWHDYMNEEKVASWEKERRAKEFYLNMLKRRCFRAWVQLPESIKKEQEKAKRLAELRNKVSSMLPDFEPSKSLQQSSEVI